MKDIMGGSKILTMSWLWLAVMVSCCLWGCQAEVGVPLNVRLYKIAHASADRFAKEMAQRHQLCLLCAGTGSMIDCNTCSFALNYTDGRRMTLEEARPMAEDIARRYAELIFADTIFAEYRECVNREYPRHARELSPRVIGFKISFWDEKFDRPLRPYVAQVRFVDGEMVYYYANPETQALEDPVTEPFTFTLPKAENADS